MQLVSVLAAMAIHLLWCCLKCAFMRSDTSVHLSYFIICGILMMTSHKGLVVGSSVSDYYLTALVSIHPH